ncbi:MAG TPA: hypothetical protein PL082_00440 [Tepidiformaceae bacterium]|nr:hypothetical protein [Tepidiformaceae bacterium]
MLVIGDVTCLHCGFVRGRWVGPKGAPLTAAGLRNQATPAAAAATDELLRCVRCAGPVFLDDASAVGSSYRLRRIRRLREQLAAMDAESGRAA